MKLTVAVLATALALLVGAWLHGLKPCPDTFALDNANATTSHDPYLEGLL